MSLARAVYQQADVVLLDDPISALDADVRKKVFKHVFQGVLKDKTRILVTHAIDFLHLADRIIVMHNGEVAQDGTYDQVKDTKLMKELLIIHKQN